jgi:hypothetical protein
MPFIRVQLSKIDPSRREAVLAYAAETIRPALEGASVLKFWQTGRDWSTGEGATLSVWETREAAEAGINALVPGMREWLSAHGQTQGATYVYETTAPLVNRL